MKLKNLFITGLLSLGTLALAVRYTDVQVSGERYVKVVANAVPKTVSITCNLSKEVNGETKHAAIRGAGAFISPNGHILTVAHLFNVDATYDSIIVTRYSGVAVPAVLLYKDTRRDLALLKIESIWWTPYLKLASPSSPKVGQEVIAIGNPLGLPFTVSHGLISALHRDEYLYDSIQMSAPLNPGNSGGPLINLRGQLVGINSFIVPVPSFFPTWSGLGFAVSASQINVFLTNFKGLDKAI